VDGVYVGPAVGVALGETLRTPVGSALGIEEGYKLIVGSKVGGFDGEYDGGPVGVVEGETLGLAVGTALGTDVGGTIRDGSKVGK